MDFHLGSNGKHTLRSAAGNGLMLYHRSWRYSVGMYDALVVGHQTLNERATDILANSTWQSLKRVSGSPSGYFWLILPNPSRRCANAGKLEERID
jgi:hypothetical protein